MCGRNVLYALSLFLFGRGGGKREVFLFLFKGEGKGLRCTVSKVGGIRREEGQKISFHLSKREGKKRKGEIKFLHNYFRPPPLSSVFGRLRVGLGAGGGGGGGGGNRKQRLLFCVCR